MGSGPPSSSASWRTVKFGGNLTNGTNTGVSYRNANNTSSNRNANIRGQLTACTAMRTHAPALAEKGMPIKGLVGDPIAESSGRIQAAWIMKRYGNIYQEICSAENVRLAHKNARKGKLHYRAVQLVDADPEKYLGKIQQTLKMQKFCNSEYTVFTKHGRKNREIYRLPYLPDRIVQHCIVQRLEPIWMRIFIRDTYSTIKGRGIHDGMKRVRKFMSDSSASKYCLKMDVKKFYPSINHDILKQILRRNIKCVPTLAILDEIIDSAPGIPIGNYLSQYFGNLYLNGLDHWIKEEKRVRYYSRYCDDMVIFESDKKRLHDLRREIDDYLGSKLQLTMKENWQVFPSRVRGVDFLGYRFWGNKTTVRKNIVKDFTRRLAHIKKHWRTMPASGVVNSVMSYYGWLAHADARGLWRHLIDNKIRGIVATVCAANHMTNPLEGL